MNAAVKMFIFICELLPENCWSTDYLSWSRMTWQFRGCVCDSLFYWTVGSPSEFGKARYLVEFQPPVSTAAGSSKDMLLPQLLTSPREKKQNAWPKRRAGKIPRPPNAFMIFANEWRRKLAFQHPCKYYFFLANKCFKISR